MLIPVACYCFSAVKNIAQLPCLKARLVLPNFKTPALKMPSYIGQMHTSNIATDLLQTISLVVCFGVFYSNFSFRRKPQSRSQALQSLFSLKLLALPSASGRKLHSTVCANNRLRGQVFLSTQR